MKRKMPEFHVHNIFLAEAYQDSFDDIFKRHLLPEDPSFYINVPSRIDPSGTLTSPYFIFTPCIDSNKY